VLLIRDFEVTDEATISEVIKNAGAQSPVIGSSTQFQRMRAAFHQADGKLFVDDAVISGPVLGASLEGEINYAANRLNLRGTFVPIYAVNNLFSRLPLIGALVGGGANEGLIGITFQLVGSIEAPTLRVNPFSAVLPGLFRKLFDFREGDKDDLSGMSTSDAATPPFGSPRISPPATRRPAPALPIPRPR
jgi:hypothetical protein